MPVGGEPVLNHLPNQQATEIKTPQIFIDPFFFKGFPLVTLGWGYIP